MAEADRQIEFQTPRPSLLPTGRADIRDLLERVESWRRHGKGVAEGDEMKYAIVLCFICGLIRLGY